MHELNLFDIKNDATDQLIKHTEISIFILINLGIY